MLNFFKLYRYVANKQKLWKKEQAQKDLFAKYGLLTKYHWGGDSRVEAGEYTYGVPSIADFSQDWRLKIGRFCCISNNVEIMFGGQHHYHHVSQYAYGKDVNPLAAFLFEGINYQDKGTKPVIIGNDVWIGKNVVILQGDSWRRCSDWNKYCRSQRYSSLCNRGW
jgi:acetyltransferase-like isoleucine patch superfamily enzyme